MSPKAFVENSQHEYDDACDCPQCILEMRRLARQHAAMLHGGYPPPRELQPWWRVSANTIICSSVIAACLVAVVLLWPSLAHARANAIHPVPAPTSLVKASKACPNTASIPQCRSALRRAYAAVAWQRHARWGATAGTSRDVVHDAIHWASSRTGVPEWQLANIGRCESHLFWLAHNGQFLGVWQLGAMHRSDPIFRVVPWMDPYAQAIHVARFIKRHGESQWQCSSSGGLRW